MYVAQSKLAWPVQRGIEVFYDLRQSEMTTFFLLLQAYGYLADYACCNEQAFGEPRELSVKKTTSGSRGLMRGVRA